MPIKCVLEIQEKDVPSDSRVGEKNSELRKLNLWIMYLFAHQPWSLWVSYLVMYGSPKYQPKTNRVLDISSANIYFFKGLAENCNSGICHCGEQCASSS